MYCPVNEIARVESERARGGGLARLIVYLWEAGSGRGVTDDPVAAREAAEGFLRSGADSAVVERAVTALSTYSLISTYARAGQGWCARLCDGRISWRQLDAESRI